MVIITPVFLKYIAGKNVRAMALFPFILVKNREIKESIETINHEKIHWKQQIEMLLILFYLLYFAFYFYFRIRGMNHYNAYMSIPFEKEAYRNQDNLFYRLNRPFWAWLKYL
jgi:hypothetical protein